MGIPLRIRSFRGDGRADCEDGEGAAYPRPVQTALLDEAPRQGDWLLVHIDTAIRCLEADEAALIGDALEALQRAARGDSFEHLIADLVDREPQLPEHLRGPAPEN